MITSFGQSRLFFGSEALSAPHQLPLNQPQLDPEPSPGRLAEKSINPKSATPSPIERREDGRFLLDAYLARNNMNRKALEEQITANIRARLKNPKLAGDYLQPKKNGVIVRVEEKTQEQQLCAMCANPPVHGGRSVDEMRAFAMSMGCGSCEESLKVADAFFNKEDLKRAQFNWRKTGECYAVNLPATGPGQTAEYLSLISYRNEGGDRHSDRFTSKTRRHLPGCTDSEATFNTIRSWIGDCEANHPKCFYPLFQGRLHFPRRVVDLRDRDRFILREDLPRVEQAAYAALSHCWGAPTNESSFSSAVVRTTLENIETHLTFGIPIANLSRTFTEAADACLRLGVYYLWIDSLCIIQDAPEDWKTESIHMADIYENARFTLAALASSGGEEGHLYSKTNSRFLSRQLGDNSGTFVRTKLPRLPESTVDAKTWPLFTRGWVFQERRLSRRMIHFGQDEVVFRCRTAQCSESGDNDETFLSQENIYGFKQDQDNSAFPYCGGDLGASWRQTIEAYTWLELTYESDRLPAVGALARHMWNLRRDGDTYIVGLWRKTLLVDLTWTSPYSNYIRDIDELPNYASRYPYNDGSERMQYPSWSWASMASAIEWERSHEPLSKITSFASSDAPTKRPDCYLGLAPRGVLHLRAPVIDLKVLAGITNFTSVSLSSFGAPAFPEKWKCETRWDRNFGEALHDVKFVHYLPLTSRKEAFLDTVSYRVQGLLLRRKPGTSADTFERLGILRSCLERTFQKKNKVKEANAEVDAVAGKVEAWLDSVPRRFVTLL